MPATYYPGGGSYRPGVLPEYYGGEPGAEIAAALRQYADARRQQRLDAMAEEESKVKVVGEKQRQAHEREMDPLERALARLRVAQAGVTIGDEAAPEEMADQLRRAAPSTPTAAGQGPGAAPMPGLRGSAFRPGASELPDIERPVGMPGFRPGGVGQRPLPMPGAFDPMAGDFHPSLPNAGGREVAGLIASGLLRAPGEVATGGVGHPPAGIVRGEGAETVDLGGGDRYDPALRSRMTNPNEAADRAALAQAGVAQGLADYLARNPQVADNVLPTLLSARGTGAVTERDRAEFQLRRDIAEAHDRATVRAAGVRAGAGVADARRLAVAQRAEATAMRDVELLEAQADFRAYQRDPASKPVWAGRYRAALRRAQAAQNRLDDLLGDGHERQTDLYDDGDGDRDGTEEDPQAVAAGIVADLRGRGVTERAALGDSLAAEMTRRGYSVVRRRH